MGKRLKWMIVVGVVIEGALMAFQQKLANRFLLFPSREPIAVMRATSFEIDAPGGKVEVYEMMSDTAGAPRAIVLNFSGNADRAENNIEADAADWRGLNAAHFAMNYPGFGRSEGLAEMGKLSPSALALYDHAIAKYPNVPVYAHGTSIGTAVALNVAANRRVDGLVLRSPAPLRSLILLRNGWWNLWLLAFPVAMGVPSNLDAVENIQKLKCPILFIQTDADTVIPRDYQRKVIDAHKGENRTVLLKQADHNDAMTRDEEAEYLDGIQWLWKQTH